MGYNEQNDQPDEMFNLFNQKDDRDISWDKQLGPSLQESLLAAILYITNEDTRKLAQILRSRWFGNPYDDMVSRCKEYWGRYNRCMESHIDDYFAYVLDDLKNTKRDLYRRILSDAWRISLTLNTQYLLDQVFVFAGRQEQIAAMYEVTNILIPTNRMPDEESSAKVDSIWQRAITTRKTFARPQEKPLLSMQDWFEAEFPPAKQFLGDFVTDDTIVIVIGPKGVGKTFLMLPMAAYIANGWDFMHWKGAGEKNGVLYYDAEMPKRRMQQRLFQLAQYIQPFPDTLHLISQNQRRGTVPMLDTPEGQQYIDDELEKTGSKVLFLDNFRSIVQPDDSFGMGGWNKLSPWLVSLREHGIGVVLGDHTGHNEDQIYGTSTKLIVPDTVVLLRKPKDPTETPGKLAFSLDFTSPSSKRRHRNEDNWRDFQNMDVVFQNLTWTGTRTKDNKMNADTTAGDDKPAKDGPSDAAIKFHQKLMEVIEELGVTGTIGEPPEEHQIVREKADWKAACWVDGLLGEKSTDSKKMRKQHAQFTHMQEELVKNEWIGRHQDEKDEYFIWNIHT